MIISDIEAAFSETEHRFMIKLRLGSVSPTIKASANLTWEVAGQMSHICLVLR